MTPATNSLVLEKLKAKFGEAVLHSEEPHGLLTITMESSKNMEVLEYLYHDKELSFQFMTDLCGLHYPNAELPIGLVYHMHSLSNNLRIRLKFFLPLSRPYIASATPLYAAANWMERETFDFYGIIFEGHPNLKRILNVDEMEVFPLRKEYPLEDPNRIDKKDLYFGR